MRSSGKILGGLLVTSIASSCGKKKDDSTTSTQPSSVAELKLSTALKIDIPDGLESAAGGSSQSLALLGGKKSSEACRVMENTDRVFENLKQIGSMFCHLEKESSQMKFGTKYTIKVTGEAGIVDETMNIWVDNSEASSLKVYMCESGKLKESFTISGFAGKEGLIKGSLASIHSGSTDGGGTESGGINMEFDFTTEGVKILTAKMKHTQTGGNFAGSFRNTSDIKIIDSGLSSIKMSNAGTRGTDVMSDQGAVLFNGSVGQALFSGAGSYEGKTYNWTTRSTFDKDGYIQAASSATSDVVVDKSTLPEKLAESFAPTEPAGWDCSGATEIVNLDMTNPAKKAEHDSCNLDHDKSFSSCWGAGFENGTQE